MALGVECGHLNYLVLLNTNFRTLELKVLELGYVFAVVELSYQSCKSQTHGIHTLKELVGVETLF
jgi:hypothetical protein